MQNIVSLRAPPNQWANMNLYEDISAVVLGLLLISALSLRAKRGGLGSLRETVKGQGICGNAVGNELSVDLPRSCVHIAHVVAKLVVARIVPIAGLSTKLSNFGLGLDALSARGDAAAGNTVADEAVVVAAAIKGKKV